MVQLIYCDFGSFGLGNAMLIHARALSYQKNFGGVIFTSRYGKIRLGPLLRSEKKKRTYFGYFRETPYTSLLLLKIAHLFLPIDVNPNHYSKDQCVVFNSKIIEGQLFLFMKDDSIYIKKKFLELLNKKVRAQLEFESKKEISIHVRRGDFKLSQQQTNLDFFICCINKLRNILGRMLSVTIFTDADENELSEIMCLENVNVEKNDFDIVDILSLAHSRIIVLSASSTFGYWAGFFQTKGVMIRPKDWQDKIQFNDEVFELVVDQNITGKYLDDQSASIVEYYNQFV
jgi:hypothetical protein